MIKPHLALFSRQLHLVTSNRDGALATVMPSEVEEILNRYADTIRPEGRQAWRQLICRDPKLAVELLDSNRQVHREAEAKAIANRAAAIMSKDGVSVFAAYNQAEIESKPAHLRSDAERARLIGNRALIIMKNRRCSLPAAWEQAQDELNEGREP